MTCLTCAVEDGFVGLCPLKTEPGDVIVLFLGGRVPFVIRRSIKFPGFYHLIGET
jgi:hypothetical protein